jgi:hypothetical protein
MLKNKPMQPGVSPKKKKFLKKNKLINFIPKFCYFYNFNPPNFFFFLI